MIIEEDKRRKQYLIAIGRLKLHEPMKILIVFFAAQSLMQLEFIIYTEVGEILGDFILQYYWPTAI